MKNNIRKILREDFIREAEPTNGRVVKLLNSLEFKDDILRAGGDIYAVGGIVRDELMGKESDDLDIVVRGVKYDTLFRILSRYGSPTDTSKDNDDDKDFGATKFVSSNDKFNQMLDDNGIVKEIDVMLPRKDAKDPNVKGHKGIQSDVNPNYTIEDDLERRDITINAVAIGLDGKVIDKGGQGQQDMKNGVIRAVSGEAFIEDPLRMLRAIRFTARFDFNIDPATLKLIRDNVRLLSDKSELPAERFLMEFKKMIGKADLGKAVKLLIDLGMYDAIFGVASKITDFTKFNKAKNLGEFAFMLFEEQRLESIPNLVLNNITNEKDVLKYVSALINYIKNVRGKNLNKGARINKLADVFNISSEALLESTYIDEQDRVIANKFVSGDLPKGENGIAFKGDEFKQFIIQTVESKFGRKYINADGPKMGMAKRLAQQAIYDEVIPNNEEAVKQFLESNVNKWLG